MHAPQTGFGRIGDRDYDYITDRLLAPAVAASEATERIQSLGHQDLADALLRAHQDFVAACRGIRTELSTRYQAQRSR